MLKTIHFLHIGKTGGSAIKEAMKRGIKEQEIYAKAKKLKDGRILDIKDLSGEFDQIVMHKHSTSLMEIPETDWFFFCIRDPISRFVSGFHSRQRQGKPRYNVPWNPKEERAFRHFKSPNELAEALSSSSPNTRGKATRAMRNIRHVNTSLSKWLVDPIYLNKRESNLLYILEQKTLSIDFEKLLQLMHFKRQLNLSNDQILTHQANSPKNNIALSDLALRNLNNHYEKDMEFYKCLTELKMKF